MEQQNIVMPEMKIGGKIEELETKIEKQEENRRLQGMQ